MRPVCVKLDLYDGLQPGSLRDHAKLLANEQKTRSFADTTISRAETIDAGNRL